MKTYSSYKESGIEWLGDVPRNWEEIKLKYIGFLYGGLSGKSGNDFSKLSISDYKPFIPFTNIANNHVIKTDDFQYVRIENGESQNCVQKGDLFFLMSSENYEDVGKASILLEELEEVYLNSFCRGFRITDEKVNPIFMNYLLSAHIYRQKVSTEAKGFTRINLKMSGIADLKVSLPSFEEQISITNFLDYKTAQIDLSIEKRREFIELLKEQRTAIINEALTKGINPDAPMKDSGIDEIGKIPRHWIKNKLKRLAEIKGRIGFRGYTTNDLVPEGKGALTLGASHIETQGKINISNPVYISWEKYYESPEIMISKGDILIVQRGSTCGKIGFIKNEIGKATINPSLVLIKEIEVNNQFLFYSLKSNLISIEVDLALNSTAIPMLSQEQIGNFKVLVPPMKEQQQVVDYIETETTRIDEEINSTQKEIDLLKQYKHSLIAEAVTGKIDVRDYPLN